MSVRRLGAECCRLQASDIGCGVREKPTKRPPQVPPGKSPGNSKRTTLHPNKPVSCEAAIFPLPARVHTNTGSWGAVLVVLQIGPKTAENAYKALKARPNLPRHGHFAGTCHLRWATVCSQHPPDFGCKTPTNSALRCTSVLRGFLMFVFQIRIRVRVSASDSDTSTG